MARRRSNERRRYACRAFRAPIVLTVALGWRAAVAGIADSPLPVLDPAQKTLHLYSVTGVIEQGIVSTYFSCTSTDTVSMKVGVETFPPLGGGPNNDAVTESVTAGPGATVILGTRTPSWTVINGVLGVGVLSGGSARILATSKKLVCTAFLAEAGSAPPAFMNQLTIVAKTKQKASN